MRIVSPLLKRAVYPSMAAAGIFRRTRRAGLAVVTYHGVLPSGYEPIDDALDGNLVPAETLRRQLRLLRKHYNIISSEDFLAWREGRFTLPERAVFITCDDGLLNCLTDMLPVLQEEQVRCLFFVTGASAEPTRSTLWYEDLFLLFLRAPAGKLEISGAGIAIQIELGSRVQRRSAWWNTVKQLSEFSDPERKSFVLLMYSKIGGEREAAVEASVQSRRFELMTLPELQKLMSSGMSIGAHTQSHPMLSRARAPLVREEIMGCKMRLESALGQAVWALAYPFGNPESINASTVQISQEAGFKAAFVNFGGGLGADLPPFALPRVHVTSNMGLGELEAQISGFHSHWQGRAHRNPRKLGTARA